MKKDEDKKSTKKEEDWIQKKWRPMMAMMYMIVCIFDFILFPIMFTIVQFWEMSPENDAFRQWIPITLGGGGLFHVAMGAVLGVSAWSRGQEKIAGAATNSVPVPANPTPISYSQSQPNYGIPQSYTQETTYTSATPVTGYKGKKAPIQPEDPII